MQNNSGANKFYPIFLNLRAKKVVIVGGGKVAERKALGLLDSGAVIHLVSPDATASIKGHHENGSITWIKKKFSPGFLDGAWLVIAATSDTDIQKKIFKEAEKRNIFCNTVDVPVLCTFIVPSTVRRGDLCLAISSSGKSPALCKYLRKELEKTFPSSYESYVFLLGELRKAVISNYPEGEREKMCNALVNPQAHEWLKQRDWASLSEWAKKVCGIQGEKIVHSYRQRQNA